MEYFGGWIFPIVRADELERAAGRMAMINGAVVSSILGLSLFLYSHFYKADVSISVYSLCFFIVSVFSCLYAVVKFVRVRPIELLEMVGGHVSYIKEIKRLSYKLIVVVALYVFFSSFYDVRFPNRSITHDFLLVFLMAYIIGGYVAYCLSDVVFCFVRIFKNERKK